MHAKLAETAAEVYICFVIPLRLTVINLPFEFEVWERAIEEILALPHDIFCHDSELNVRDVSLNRLDEEANAKFSEAHQIGYYAGRSTLWKPMTIRVSASVGFDESMFSEFDPKDVQVAQDQLSCQEFGRTVRRILVSALIAHPGVIRIETILVCHKDRVWDREDNLKGLLHENLSTAQRMKWPSLLQLKTLDVWNWLSQLEGFKEDFGIGRFG